MLRVCPYSCLSYPARQSHLFCAALQCHLWPGPLYHIFPLYLTNGTIFEEKLLKVKYVFWFSLQLSVRNMCFDFLYNFLSEICVLIFSTTFCPKYVFWFSLQLSVRNMCFDFLYNFLSEICVLIFSITFCPKYVFWFFLQLSIRNMCFDFL